MLVILEGMERTGKSTLAKALEERGFINFKDHNRFREFDVDAVKHRLDSTLSFLIALNEAGQDVVLDRFHLSEIVYSISYRGNSLDELSYNFFIDTALAQMDTVLVHCIRDINENYLKAFPDKGFSSKELKEISNRFDYFIDKSEIRNKFIVDLSKESASSFLLRMKSELGITYADQDDCVPLFDPEPEEYDPFVDPKSCSVERSHADKYDFYLASPFFNKEQVDRMKKVLQMLRFKKYIVYAPFEHGIVAQEEGPEAIKEVFESNVQAIQSSNKVLAITDGKDMGTIWEAGYAYGIGKPVVYYAETLGNNAFNLMLSESGIGIYTNFHDLVRAAEMDDFTKKAGVVHE